METPKKKLPTNTELKKMFRDVTDYRLTQIEHAIWNERLRREVKRLAPKPEKTS